MKLHCVNRVHECGFRSPVEEGPTAHEEVPDLTRICQPAAVEQIDAKGAVYEQGLDLLGRHTHVLDVPDPTAP